MSTSNIRKGVYEKGAVKSGWTDAGHGMKVWTAVTPYSRAEEFVAYKVHDPVYGEFLLGEFDTMEEAMAAASRQARIYKLAPDLLGFLKELAEDSQAISDRSGVNPPVCLKHVQAYIKQFEAVANSVAPTAIMAV